MDISASSINNSYTSTNTTATADSNSNLTMDDFFELMVAQLQNQSMMDPVDHTEFIGQMAQFTSLSQMKELANMGQMSYAVSLIGKDVTISSVDEVGNRVTATGTVDNVFYNEGIPYLEVNGMAYQTSDVVKIENGLPQDKVVEP